MNAQSQRARASSQLTLGDLIDCLKAMPADAVVANLRDPDSYRGYYCDLYFELHDGIRPATELLTECQAAMGNVFTGYKGGEYVMGALTPLWIASRRCLGKKIMDVRAGGAFTTSED